MTHSIPLKLAPGISLTRHSRTVFRWLVALALVSTLTLTAGEEVKLHALKVDKKTYRRVTVLGVSETDLYFRHSSGISNVKLKYLSPELQKRFGYDPVAAAEAERQQMEEDSAFFETVALDLAERAQKAAAAAEAAAQAAARKAASTEATLADPIGEQSLLNQPAPKLEFGKWLGEKPETEGKAMLIFFWATWSTPCRKAIGEMNKLRKSFQDQLVVIGWSAQEEKDVTTFSDETVDFPLAVDPDGKLARTAGVTSVPQAMLIDGEGVVRYVGHPAALTSKTLKKALAQSGE